MSGGVCGSCMMWGEYYYWNHMSDEKKQFIAVAWGNDFKNSMRIPQEVGTHLRSIISETIKVEAPNGRIYHIGVCREMGELVLRSGWDELVAAHHVEENYYFLFSYRGNSSFKVHIFSSTGHEKSSSCSEPPPEIFGAIPPGALCDHHVLNEQLAPCPGHVETSTDHHVLNEQAAPCPGHVETSSDFNYTMLPGCCLTQAQDDKVSEIAHTMCSEIPLYAAAMNRSNVSSRGCSIYIPLRLLDHFKDKEYMTEATIQLQAPDCNIYSVGASKYSDDQIVLQSGWGTFVASHHIQENYLLIFRSKAKARLEVLILDPSGCQKTSSCFATGDFSSTQEMREDSVGVIDPPPTVIDLSSSDDDHVVGEDTRKRVPGRCAKTRKMASTSSPCAKSEYAAHKPNDGASTELGVDSKTLSPNNLEGPSKRPYILSRGITLTKMQKMKVEEKVQEIQSGIPIFVAVMKAYMVNDYPLDLRFCKEYVSSCIPAEIQTLVLQLEGDKVNWHTKLRLDPKGGTCISGWRVFVYNNCLRKGDICLFELAKRTAERLTMTVYIIRNSGTKL